MAEARTRGSSGLWGPGSGWSRKARLFERRGQDLHAQSGLLAALEPAALETTA